MNMKAHFLILVILLVIKAASAQEVISMVEKTDYDINEMIQVKFEMKSKVDSMSKCKVDGFYVVTGPVKNTSSTMIEGKTENRFNLEYEIKAKQSGKLTLSSPVFYFQGKAYKAKDIVLNISGKSLSEAELKKIEFDDFRNKSAKPDGTIRYVLTEDMGYVEVYLDGHWKLLRALSKKEIKRLKLE
jgi:hypothetical protein